MIRLSALLVLSAAGVLCDPMAASAQFGRPPGVAIGGFGGFGFNNRLPGLPSYANPFGFVPQYRYASGYQYNFNVMGGNFSIGARSYAYAPYPLYNPNYYYGYLYSTNPAYSQSGSYMTGGASTRADLVQAAQRELSKAQREAALPGARDQIAGQWNYEKGAANVAAQAGPEGLPDALLKALAASNPADIPSGEALNEVLKEIIRLEAKGAKGPSAFVTPLLFDEVRFAGAPAADLLNFARKADAVEFPVAFEDPALAALRGELEKDFAAAAAAVRAGKAPEAARLTKLEVTFQRVQDAAGPVVRNLPFEDATAARRFLNRMAGAIKAMKGTTPVGLIDPKWSGEGLTVADLVKLMTRHKLVFAPAPRGSEEAYTAMHRNLATYLFVLAKK